MTPSFDVVGDKVLAKCVFFAFFGPPRTRPRAPSSSAAARARPPAARAGCARARARPRPPGGWRRCSASTGALARGRPPRRPPPPGDPPRRRRRARRHGRPRRRFAAMTNPGLSPPGGGNSVICLVLHGVLHGTGTAARSNSEQSTSTRLLAAPLNCISNIPSFCLGSAPLKYLKYLKIPSTKPTPFILSRISACQALVFSFFSFFSLNSFSVLYGMGSFTSVNCSICSGLRRARCALHIRPVTLKSRSTEDEDAGYQ